MDAEKGDGEKETGRQGENDLKKEWPVLKVLVMKINSFRELRVYYAAIEASMKIFEITKTFPKEEIYSMKNQMRRASRSVCANIGEAWRRGWYKAAFIAKLNDSETEATET